MSSGARSSVRRSVPQSPARPFWSTSTPPEGHEREIAIKYRARSNRTITNLLARIDFHSNIEVHEHTEMITRPNSVDGFVKGKLGGFDVAVRVRMRVPRTDEHVVDPPSMIGLTNNRLHLGARVWIINVPGVTRTIASHRPSVVVVRTSPVDRLLTGEIADARRFGSRVEVASDDCRKLAAVTSVKVAERDRLSLTCRLSFSSVTARCVLQRLRVSAA
jgi:hypothetical protein